MSRNTHDKLDYYMQNYDPVKNTNPNESKELNIKPDTLNMVD